MGAIDSWEKEGANLCFNPQGTVKEPEYTHYDT